MEEGSEEEHFYGHSLEVHFRLIGGISLIGIWSTDDENPSSIKAFKRLKKEGIDKKKTTCMLYLQADHLFHEQMGYSEEASIEMMTRHVQRVNSIYKPIGRYIARYSNQNHLKGNLEIGCVIFKIYFRL